MLGLGRLLKAAKGGGDLPPATSTIPREVAAPRSAATEPPWDPVKSEPSETREAERFVPRKTATALTMADGRRIQARIINISRTGVAVETGSAIYAATDVNLVGTRPVTPGRRIALGQVFVFKKPLDPKLCGPDMVL